MKSKDTLIDQALTQIRFMSSEAYKRQVLESLYNRAYEAGKVQEEYLYAHMGVKPDGTTCMKKFPGAICSMCIQNVTFKIHVSQWEILEKLVKKDRDIYVVRSRDDMSFLSVFCDRDRAEKSLDNQVEKEEMSGGKPSVFITETKLQ